MGGSQLAPWATLGSPTQGGPHPAAESSPFQVVAGRNQTPCWLRVLGPLGEPRQHHRRGHQPAFPHECSLLLAGDTESSADTGTFTAGSLPNRELFQQTPHSLPRPSLQLACSLNFCIVLCIVQLGQEPCLCSGWSQTPSFMSNFLPMLPCEV